MGSVIYWSMVVILYQTVISIIIGWLTLSCQFRPTENEFHEVTLVKLLYLYDPEACGRVFFYNYTIPMQTCAIVWPVRNNVAADFRVKISAWLSLHVVWCLLGVAYISQGARPCGLYATLIPFTLAGAATLVMDVTYTTMFLMDVNRTSTEARIMTYINSNKKDLRTVTKSEYRSINDISSAKWEPDTSWISLFMAYASCRGVVQWLINFWIVKDNFSEGTASYHRMQRTNIKIQRSSALM